MNIEQLIGETTEYDKKLMVEERKSKSWLKSVSAFANGIGGCLIFGIGDDDTIVGLQDAKKDSETISEIIKTKMDPIPKTILEISNVAEKEIIILKVFSGQETPYYYYGDGNRIAYVRVGNESIPADSVALKRLVLRGTNLSYDSVVSQYKFDKYSFTKLRTVYRIQTGNELDENAVSEEKQHSEDIQTALSDDKQHFEDVETALSAIRDSILVLDVSSISKNNIISLLDEFGLIKPFTRNDIMNQLNITASPASAIIRKLKNFDLIDHVKGKKRGLYRFKPVGK